MDAQRWRQVDRVLQGALGLFEAERAAYLDEACAGDAELRAEVEVLLGFEPKVEPFLAAPAVESLGIEINERGMVGRVVGPYRIEALVGTGGMGAVYRARDERLGRAVAIKVVHEHLDRGLMRRFTQEARLVSSLNHPNIVTVHDMVESDGARLLVTEYVEGVSLRARMRDGMETGEAIEVARQIATALEAAHRAGVVHRDIKPENVIVRADGLVKVLDFGIAKLVEGERTGAVGGRGSELEIETEVETAPGMVIGTASYMSPEQTRGVVVDGRTDVWSLGVMLYEMVAGHRPFRGPTRADVVVAVLGAEPEAESAIPSELGEVIDRALRKRAEERYATAAEMAAALEALKWRLADGGVRTDEAAASTAAQRTVAPTNLPEERTALIGRERELRTIVDELRETRLLTVTGAGGTGKTRLATEAGRALLYEFGDGVYFVELAAIRDPALVVSAIAQALGLKEAAGVSLDETVAAFVSDRELLLVLDNFEQVLSAAPLVARLLEASPRLKALVTSREHLNVMAEREHALGPLALPPADATDEELERYGSVALFVARARALRPGFSLATSSEANRRAVAEICRRLDGLPLAIELAAARLRMLTPEALLARLDRQLKLLTSGAQDAPERQQTMQATIAWSYDLLTDDERRLFARLSVFSGGWTLSAAEALAPDLDVLDLLTHLADKSLVAVEAEDEGMRYRMLEPIRQFAAERLGETGETDGVRSAHAAWLVPLVEGVRSEYERTGSTSCLSRLDPEQENVRAALEWSAGDGGAPEVLLRLGAAMGMFWWNRGRWSEGRSWLERGLEADRALTPARALAFRWTGALARWQSDLKRARELLAASLALYRELGDRLGAGGALADLATVVQWLGDIDDAEAMNREGLELCDDDARLRGRFLHGLASVAYDREDFDGGAAFSERSLAAYREVGERTVDVASALYNLAVLRERLGEYARATELLEESLPIARELAQRPLVPRVIHYLGTIAGVRCDYVRAAEYRAEAAREYVALGDRYMTKCLVEDVVEELVARGMAERAARLFGAITQLAKMGVLPDERPGVGLEEEILARLRAEIGEVETERAMARGRGLTLDATLTLAFAD